MNELRKTLGRNMRFAQMNSDIDNQIRQLQARTSYDVNAQMQINALEQQRALNEQQMQQPMTEQEYASYDDNGDYIGSTPQQSAAAQPNTGGFGQAFIDGINHAAQGASLGWSDEAFGAIGGAGRVMANGIMRAFGQNVNGESFGDAWNKGYQEYRDFARQELQDGYERNPAISGLAEVGGALASPIKPFKAKDRINMFDKVYHTTRDLAVAGPRTAIANGVIGGIGITNQNNPLDYAQNIAFSTIGNLAGNKINTRIHGVNDMYPIRRKIVEGFTNVGSSIANNFVNNIGSNGDKHENY